ncbi:DNA polymerase III, delta subunit [Roseiflexus castenholzii DSM 13941]|uniref:DNA polymerase III subunit delta n=1 Tax=Roseiflexus castenholzii (strain DSM 13941 / HLO8) TaxID=383372 RepID=A7NNV2_ROSCS|nr:DNA polymerase III, delta subunit [Roseiflexus castenholzii DSM 13941]
MGYAAGRRYPRASTHLPCAGSKPIRLTPAVGFLPVSGFVVLFLVYGPDEYGRSEALAALKARVPAEVADLNITTLDGRRTTLSDIVAACEAMPFLADRRLVIVDDLLKHQKAGKDRDDVRAYLEHVPDACDLVFVESDEFDKRSSLFTFLKKHAEVRECVPREGADLLRWLSDRAKGLGVTLERDAAQRLTLLAGNDSRLLVTELTKLATFVGRRGRITVREVDLLVADRQEQNLFSFIDELSARRRSAALTALRRLLDDGQAAQYILFMMARQVRILMGVRDLAAQRLRPDDIANRLGQKPFVVRKALEQAHGFSDADLQRLHRRLLELDHASKTGRAAIEAGLELIVADMCS